MASRFPVSAASMDRGSVVSMDFGLFAIGADQYAHDPDTAVAVAQAAERAGWESVWVGEHYALPDPQPADFFIDPDTAMLDPFVALANVAAHTTTLRIGTGIIVLPLHHPFHLAKLVVSLDRVSAGRLLFGVGVGYLEPALRAFGTSLDRRGGESDELLASVLSLFHDRLPEVRWRGIDVRGLRAEPRPTVPGGPPIHVGGDGAAAFRRVATVGTGWFGWCVDAVDVAAARAGIAAAVDQHGRGEGLGRVEISVTPPLDLEITGELVERYRAAGVDRLIVMPPLVARTEESAALEFVERVIEF